MLVRKQIPSEGYRSVIYEYAYTVPEYVLRLLHYLTLLLRVCECAIMRTRIHNPPVAIPFFAAHSSTLHECPESLEPSISAFKLSTGSTGMTQPCIVYAHRLHTATREQQTDRSLELEAPLV